MTNFSFKAIDPARAVRLPSWLIWLAGYSGLIFLLLWILPFAFRLVGRDSVSLHTTVFFGIDLIGRGSEILVLPSMATAILVVHGVLVYCLRRVTYLVVMLGLTAALLLTVLLLGMWWLRLANI